jgi:hypothetical protein
VSRSVPVLPAACLLITVQVLLCLSFTSIAVTDFWWQAKAGELIVQTRTIPRHDPFSWTAPGEPWVVHEWLTSVLFYLALRHLPDGWLLVYKCGLATMACLLVLGRAYRRSGSLIPAILAAVLAAGAVRNYADLRPQMLSFVLLAGLFWVLDEYRCGRLGRLPWLLPPLFAVWANLHGGVVVGIIVFALWILGEALAAWWLKEPASEEPSNRTAPTDPSFPGRHADRKRLARLAAGLGVSAAAAMLTPIGWQVYRYPFQVLGHPEVTDYIGEWFSPDFHMRTLRPFEIALLGSLGLLGFERSTQRGQRWGERLVLLALAHAALTAQRHTPTFTLAAAPAIAGALADLARSGNALSGLRCRLGTSTGRTVAYTALGVFLVGLASIFRPPVPPKNWVRYATRMDAFPEEAVRELRAGRWPGRLYHDYIWGGYLAWELYPQRRVFVDGRAEVFYRSGAFDDEMVLHRVAEGWPKVLDRRGIEVVLTQRQGALAAALDRHTGWRREFAGAAEAVFVRAEPRR